jgi:hypothetical protein
LFMNGDNWENSASPYLRKNNYGRTYMNLSAVESSAHIGTCPKVIVILSNKIRIFTLVKSLVICYSFVVWDQVSHSFKIIGINIAILYVLNLCFYVIKCEKWRSVT